MVEARDARSVPVGECLRLEQRTLRPPCATVFGALGGNSALRVERLPVGSRYRNAFVAATFSAHRLTLERLGFQAPGAAVKVRSARRRLKLQESKGAEAHMIKKAGHAS